ncbi:MAG: archaemetzincin family Zn-dependent metalloprotease [Candidatus Hodarchaeaceae archaeon]|nr:archaemetzincin family Zn-dependent metalloprotease [Candidatus Hodarchaeaceae archaeon]
MINIIKIGEIPNKLLRDLMPRLLKRYEKFVEGCQVGTPLELPVAAYDPHRMQYRADIVLERVLHTARGEGKVLALTDVDLYVPRLNFVFGQAQCPGTVALVSLRRLDPAFYGEPSDYELLLKRATKEAVHELGHTFGLNHCSALGCVMTFSNSIFEVDEKKAKFCERCLNKLHARRP